MSPSFTEQCPWGATSWMPILNMGGKWNPEKWRDYKGNLDMAALHSVSRQIESSCLKKKRLKISQIVLTPIEFQRYIQNSVLSCIWVIMKRTWGHSCCFRDARIPSSSLLCAVSLTSGTEQVLVSHLTEEMLRWTCPVTLCLKWAPWEPQQRKREPSAGAPPN